MTGAKPRDHATHDLDELSEALDGRLAETRHEQVRERLQTCPDCQAAYEAMAWSRAQARGQPAVASPSGLEEGLWDAVAARIKRTTSVRRTLGLGLAAALVAGLTTLLARLGSGPAPLPAAAANEFRERAAGRVLLGIETSDASRLEAWFTSASLGFSPRVLDLGMMGYVLQGGAVRELAGRPVAVSVYRETATGRDVLCLMLRGGLAELPAPESTREHSGFRFQVYRREGVTLVFWPEGEVLCALVGGGDPEALVQLAFAKAMVARPAEGG